MNLGAQIRRHRKEQSLTLREVAGRTGLSEGFLSQVENNVKSPSVDNLVNICTAVGADVGQVMKLAAEHKRLYTFTRAEWDEVDLPHTGFATRRFCPPEERSVIDPSVLFMEPGSRLPVRKGIKNGQEVLCVLEGSLELVHPEGTVLLNKGDAVHLWTQPDNQSITNSGDRLAVVLWIGTL